MLTKIGIVVLILIFVCAYFQIRYSNPYKLYMIFGRKGCGKTTYLAMIAQKYLRKGWVVYSTEAIPGTYRIKPDDVGLYDFGRNVCILMDEVGITYDNRKFKTFADTTRDWFKYQRHYRTVVYLFSQTFDVDSKLRTLTDSMVMLKNYFNVLTVGRKLRLKQTVIKATGLSEASIKDDIVPVPFIFGGLEFVWLPRYWKYFDSYNEPLALKEGHWNITPYPDGIKPVKPANRRFKRRKK